MSERRSESFHSHVYFDAESRASASALREILRRELPTVVQISRLVDRPIGPHPKPMFEVDFSAADYPRVRALLEMNHGEHSVLIHQLTDDEVWDHTVGAEWIGAPLELDLQFLRDFMAGHEPGVRGTIPFKPRS